MANDISVKDLVEEIKESLTQKNSSQKDEIRVMQAMLNDTSFKVDVYGNDGKEGEYCPAEDFKGMVSSIIAEAAKSVKRKQDLYLRIMRQQKTMQVLWLIFQKNILTHICIPEENFL